jgi:primosomal protein N' (replication factor Y)
MLLESVLEADDQPDNAAQPLVAEVLVPVAVDTSYSYCVPAGLDIAAGDFVTVPLGTRETTGVVWSVRASGSGGNLKAIAARRDLPRLEAIALRRLDRALHLGAARHGAAHGGARARCR